MSTPPVEVASLYVHAPFCARRCLYCDFAVSVRREGDPDAWLAALAGELMGLRSEGLFRLAPRLRTLYVGGGTPSLLGPGSMTGLRDLLGADRLDDSTLEWTAEANPESFTHEVAHDWVAAGVNRVSLGAQTFHEPALRWMGRLHGVQGPGEAVRRARAVGLDNVSVDLIFGLPRHLGRDWRRDLERTLDLDVPHVSLYGLTVEEGTPLGRAVAEGRESNVDDEQYEEEFLLAADLLSEAGYEQYEVSNFARPGRRSRHNASYWSGGPYLGLGNGAHSFAPPIRRWNVRAWEVYHAKATGGTSTEDDREVVDARAARLERIWLGLRTVEGLSIDDAGAAAVALVDGWIRAGLGWREDGRFGLTPRGWLILDRISVELDAVWEG